MIYISNEFHILDAQIPARRNRSLIGWKSVVQPGGFDANGWGMFSPPSNLWSPDTSTRWAFQSAGPDAILYITMQNPLARKVNYIGIGGHNFGSTSREYWIEIYDGSEWVEHVPPKIPSDDRSIMEFFNDTNATQVRIAIQYWPSQIIFASHIRMGEILRLQRPNSGDREPYALSKEVKGFALTSDNGNYNGNIITSQWLTWDIEQRNNTPDFVRAEVYPFIDHMNGTRPNDGTPKGSFFASWLPETYPTEVVYAWKDPNQAVKPYHSPTNQLMNWSCSGRGMA